MAGETISFNQINWKLKVSHEIEGYTLILGEIKGQQRHLCCADVLFDYNLEILDQMCHMYIIRNLQIRTHVLETKIC